MDPPPARDYRDDQNSDPPTGNWITPNPNDPNRPPAPPAKDSGAPASSPDRPASARPVTVAVAYRLTDQREADRTEGTTNAGSSWVEVTSAPRQEVLKAARALREMPPFAREREIDFGRYSNLSPKEQEMLRSLLR